MESFAMAVSAMSGKGLVCSCMRFRLPEGMPVIENCRRVCE